MHPLILKLLKKRNIELNELTEDEKETYSKWQEVLSTELTLDTLKAFCLSQKDIIEKEIVSPDNSDKKDNNLRATLGVYMSIIGILENTGSNRIALIKHLESLIK